MGSYKVKHPLYEPAICLLDISPKEIKTMFTKRFVHVYGSFCNSETLEKTRRIDEIVTHLYTGIYSEIKGMNF